MARSYKYAVLRVTPDVRRGESVNVGLAIFTASGIDVRILPSLSKVSALSGQIDLASLRQLPQTVAKWTSGVEDIETKHALLRNLGVVTVSGLGCFESLMPQDYEERVAHLMRTLVTPLAARRVVQTGTKIKTALRSHFRGSKILGDSVTDIARHLVVPNYPIDTDEGLYADFVVKNGTYHVTETADFRSAHISTIGRVRVASYAAIKLDKAKQSFGNQTKRFVVFAGREDIPAQPLNLLSDYADSIFNLDSPEDMANYMSLMVEAACQQMPPLQDRT